MRLGKYQLIRQLAIGGMAEVYLARAKGIEGFTKRVVLKRILPQYATNKDFIKMFLDEARLAARLDHPNVVQVYDIGQTVGNYYFTMEYVQGQDVRNILKTEHRAGRAVPLGCSLTIARGLCAGLHYAHEMVDLDGTPLGIVHRDVSLSNVLVSYDGGVKIVDFGVAKCVAKETQTRAGTLKGKIAYMSPEQCRGEALDQRSDVFALGIILFELTTGTRLFAGESEFAILQKIATRDVESPATRVTNYPPELERIVLKALARDKTERYQTARDLQRDIENFARDERLALSAIELSEYMAQLFAEEISSQPSDSGVSDASKLRDAATKAATPRPRKLADIESRDDGDESIVVIDATDGQDANGGADAPVYTAMFEAPPPDHDLAMGSGEHESVAASAVHGVVGKPRRRNRFAAFALGAVVALAAATAFTVTRDQAVAPDEVPVLTVDDHATAVKNVVRIQAPAKVIAPAPAAAPTPVARAAPDRATTRRLRKHRTPNKKTNPTWNPDSALPPSL